MKDLQSLLGHASFKDADKVLLASGQPITAWTGGSTKQMGQPLTNQAIHGLLKTSLPPDVMAQCKWGKSLTHALDVDGRTFQLQIELTAEKQIRIQAEADQVGMSGSAPQPAPVVSAVGDMGEDALEQAIEALSNAENGALCYLPEGLARSAVEDACSQLGYEPRVTDQAQPVMEVIKFGEFPFMLMHLGANFQSDPVFAHLKLLTMDLRRQMFSVLVAPGLRTGDTMQAFVHSVHLVVSPDDIGNLVAIVQKAKQTWQRHVATFHEYLAAEGKL